MIPDGTHVPVEPLRGERLQFWNRKKYCSINVLIVSGMHYFIHYVSVMGPGGSHDSGIFKKTPLYGWLERGLYMPFRNAILIADSAYEVRYII